MAVGAALAVALSVTPVLASHDGDGNSNGPRDFVTGGGKHLGNGVGPEVVRTSVSAHVGPDGDARGRITTSLQFSDAENQPAQAQVTCLIVVGNEAFITSVVDREGSGLPDGTVVVTHIVDNDATGGIPGAPDLIRHSFAPFIVPTIPPEGQDGPCFLPVLAPVTVVSGNYVVHDA
jgi:hypothetical protein